MQNSNILFDQSSGHCAYVEDVLIASRMNVSDGGKQPFMRNTRWDGEDKSMVTDKGLQKGLKSLLEDHHVNTVGMKKEDMIKIVEEMRDLMHGYHSTTKFNGEIITNVYSCM